jgi:glutamate carboxypeptidase
VLVSPDEEIGSLGSGPVLAALGAKAHVGMTYEPALADGSLAGARKGSGNFSLRCLGKAAHAGREHHLGRNAIVAAAEFANRLDALNAKREQVTFNVSRIDGGGAPNVVPELGICRFNVRVKTEEDAAWAKAEIAALVQAANTRDGITADLHGGFTRPPKPMSPANQRMFEWTRTAGSAIGLDIRWNDTGGVCEGNNLWASGCPNVDTLGVCGADIHSDRERAKLSSFAERARLSAVMLMAFARGRFDAGEARALAGS